MSVTEGVGIPAVYPIRMKYPHLILGGFVCAV
jgi:hypothetical protein